ncbi:MAG: hypothetical protein GC154_15420 [bacterium]|nr:hypothetical protein [bacterium]
MTEFPVFAVESATAFAIRSSEWEDAPQGLAAEWSTGDWALRNGDIALVIAGEGQPHAGCIIDLAMSRSRHDELVLFAPLMLDVTVETIGVEIDPNGGVARVIVNSHSNDLRIMYRYELRPRWRGVLITTSVENRGVQPASIPTGEIVAGVTDPKVLRDVHIVDSVDPAMRTGYAYAWIAQPGAPVPGERVSIEPEATVSFARFLAPGDSPAYAFGIVNRVLRPEEVGGMTGEALDGNSKPVDGATIRIQVDGQWLNAYPDADGYVMLPMPNGAFDIKAYAPGRPQERDTAVVKYDEYIMNVVWDEPSYIQCALDEPQGEPLIVRLEGLGSTRDPNLGKAFRDIDWTNEACLTGPEFTIPCPPGRYRMTIRTANGAPEWVREVLVEEGMTAIVNEKGIESDR